MDYPRLPCLMYGLADGCKGTEYPYPYAKLETGGILCCRNCVIAYIEMPVEDGYEKAEWYYVN